MWQTIRKLFKIAATIGLVINIVLTGFPVTFVFEKIAENKIVDSLYLSTKARKVVDNFEVPTARANPGTRVRTVEFFAGQDAGSATNDNVGAQNNFAAQTAQLAESGADVIDAYVELSAEVGGTTALTSTEGLIYFDVCSPTPCTPSPAIMMNTAGLGTNSAEAQTLRFRASVTSEATLAAYTGAGTQFSFQVGYCFDGASGTDAATCNGTAAANVQGANAKLVITYIYDDTSATQTNTVIYPLDSGTNIGSKIATQAACTIDSNCPAFSYNAEIPEISSQVSQFFFLQTSLNANSATDWQTISDIGGNPGGANTSAVYFEETLTNNGGWINVMQGSVAGYANNSAQSLEMSTNGTNAYVMGGENYVTYTYANAAATKTRTVVLPVGEVQTIGSLTKSALVGPTVYFPETGVTVKKAWFRVHTSAGGQTTASTLNITHKVGNNAESSARGYAFAADTQGVTDDGYFIYIIPSSEYAELQAATASSGKTAQMTAQWSGTARGAVSGELVITYTYTGESGGYLVTQNLFAAQQTTAAATTFTTATGAINPSIPEITGTITIRGASSRLNAKDTSATANGTLGVNLSTGSCTASNTSTPVTDSEITRVMLWKNVTSVVTNSEAQTYTSCYSGSQASIFTGNLIITYQWDAPATNTLTIGVTAGSKVTTVNSGDSAVYANTTSCSGPASCAAMTLSVSNTSVTVSSIKITETGTANATTDLSQLALFYDTDGNYSNGITGQYGATVASFTSEAATVSGSLALIPATTYYFYVRFNASSTTSYPKGGQTVNFQIAANGDVTLSSGSATITGAPVSMAGTTTILPKVSSVSYGAGLSDGARSSETITISGYGFGVAPGGSRANCAGAVDTGCVRFLVGGAATVADSSVSSWSNISVGLTVSSTLATLGGASSLEVVSGSQGTATDINYYIYPNITALTATAAREYDAGDADGLVMLSGDHFGSAQGTVSSTGAFGNANLTIHSIVEGSCTVAGWSASGYSGNTVCVEITPSSIPDSVYSGSITLNRNTDAKTDIESNFGIMPRIISNTPANGVVADVIQILGNHFCQSGTCPVSPNRSDASNNVKFGATQALDSDFVNQSGGAGACNGAGAAWTNTEICVKVPSGIPAGSQPTKVRTNATYDSNTKAFTVNSTIPNDPINLNQYKQDGVTIISAGGTATSSTVVLKATSTASLSINMLLQVEVEPTGTAFDGIGIIDGPICTGCTSTSTAVSVSGLSDGNKHWRARTKNNSTSETSNWVYYGTSDINEIDFKIDVTAPVISNVQSSNVGTNSATITWSTDEQSTSQVQYNKTGSFVSDCATNNDCTTLDSNPVTSHTVNLSNLDSGATYYYRVRSKDAAGNEAISSNYTFTTGSVTQPAKTTVYYAYATTSVVSAGATASSSFSIFMPETSASTTSAFLELTGLSLTSGTNNVQVWVNSQTAKTYAIASNKNLFKIVYKIDGANINIDPTPNAVYIIPSIDTYVVSSRIVITYKYTP
ncbi:MAG: fibronectin type III domain-containing protein [Patescibacteria group bacterium]